MQMRTSCLWNARTVMARISFLEMGMPTITLGLPTARSLASTVNVCFFCLRTSRVFNVAPHKHLMLASLAGGQALLFLKGRLSTTDGPVNPTLLFSDFASKLDH
jgi:hypothetical protein